MFGFWSFPTNWDDTDLSVGPTGYLMRIFSEEVFGTKFTERLDFGYLGNKLFFGSIYTGPSK